ncbi:uncharacterized protein LOC123314764 [Coccinella septempunctata]|uniref:uncharacterized protein LOC123314764 n=1 Tax=Coccinella septempunctata TaxID=41139 RepID=UPI001D099474|nr:uncharacterized protein LOC123314764 [Coccinella septempunctata]
MERLIKLVEGRPLLYDCKHADFQNRVKKMEEWNAIAEIMGSETGNYWRFKWSRLKENYSKYKKVSQNPSNHIYKKYRKWPWAKYMRFTDDFPNKRASIKTKGANEDCPESVSEEILIENDSGNNLSVRAKCEVQPEFSEELSEFLDVTKSNGNLIQNQIYLVEQESSEENLDLPIEDIKVIIQKNDHTNPKRRKTKSNPAENVSNYFKNKNNMKNEFDEVEHFFISYAQTFKRLPSRLQRVLKLEMVTLFARYELQAESLDTGVTQQNMNRV